MLSRIAAQNGLACRRQDDQVQRQDHREHREEADQVRADDRERQELARELDLLHEVRVAQEAAREDCSALWKKTHTEQPGNEEERIVRDRERAPAGPRRPSV
jgi:hypothetical protein